MMMGFGFLIMLAVLALPLLLIAGLVIWQRKSNDRQVFPGAPAIPSAARVCAHCGAGLQTGWSHCPQCGAPTG